MFKIKTKKDIRIEELEKEVEGLLHVLALTRNPLTTYTNRNVREVVSVRFLAHGEPVEHAKRRIATNFAEGLEPYIHYDIEDDYSLGELSQKITGRLQVVENRRLGQ